MVNSCSTPVGFSTTVHRVLVWPVSHSCWSQLTLDNLSKVYILLMNTLPRWQLIMTMWCLQHSVTDTCGMMLNASSTGKSRQEPSNWLQWLMMNITLVIDRLIIRPNWSHIFQCFFYFIMFRLSNGVELQKFDITLLQFKLLVLNVKCKFNIGWKRNTNNVISAVYHPPCSLYTEK